MPVNVFSRAYLIAQALTLQQSLREYISSIYGYSGKEVLPAIGWWFSEQNRIRNDTSQNKKQNKKNKESMQRFWP